jgi:peroxiredoxin
MDGWQKAWSDRGARVVAISVDKEQHKARRFAEQAKLSLTVFHDGPSGLAKKLDLPSLPCTFVLDRQGNAVMVVESSSKEDLARVLSKVESLLITPTKAGMSAITDGGLR